MKKHFLLVLIMVISSVLMVACGSEEAEETTNEDTNTEEVEESENTDGRTEEDESTSEEDETESQAEEDDATEIEEYVKAYDEEVLDSDEVRIVLKEIKKQDGNMMNRGYYLDFEVENKLDIDIIVKSIKEAADGKMIDDMVQFIETIEANDTTNVEMTIINYWGDFYEINELIEMVIVVLEEEKATEINEYDVEIHMPSE